MTKLKASIRFGLPALIAVAGLSLAVHEMGGAADHLDPPARVGSQIGAQTDPAADIADLYAFHDANNLYLALNFAGPMDPQVPPFYDRNVLYTINLSNDGVRTTTEFPIEIRFGNDGQSVGMRVTGLPGNTTIVGPVDANLTSANGIVARAGLFDDPFFFDLQGFRDTRSTGNLAFNNQRNPFAGRNTTFIVLQIPRRLIQTGQPLDVWAATARIGS